MRITLQVTMGAEIKEDREQPITGKRITEAVKIAVTNALYLAEEMGWKEATGFTLEDSVSLSVLSVVRLEDGE